MEKRTAAEELPSLNRTARLTGAMYVPYLAFGVPLFLRMRLVIPNDAGASAARIIASQNIYRITIVTDLVSYALYIVLAYLFYVLLRQVNRPWAAVATLFTLAGCIVLIASSALLTAPLLLLDQTAFHATGIAERQELALFALKLFSQGYTIGLLLFGAQWLIMGPLFAKSGLVPRAIGYWLLAGGIGWVVLAIATLLGSPFRLAIQGLVLPVAGLAEITLGLWLLVFGGRRARAADL